MAALRDRPKGWLLRQALPIVLLLGMGIVASRLGIWQLERAEQKSAIAKIRAEARSSEPIVLELLDASAILGAAGRHLVIPPKHVPPSVLDGAPLPAEQGRAANLGPPGQSSAMPDALPAELGPATWYLDNRTHKGMPGVHVLAVLPLSSASASTIESATSINDSAMARGAVVGQRGHLPNQPDHVLLLRGWQPKDPQYPQGIRPGGKIRTDVKIVVRVEPLADTRHAPVGGAKGVAGDQPWHWLGIDHEEMGRNAGISLLPMLLRQIEDATDLNNIRVDDGLVRNWVEPSEGVEKHRGYAFQWFLLTALCAVLAVGLVWRSLRPAREILGAPSR